MPRQRVAGSSGTRDSPPTPERGLLTCRYSLDGREFAERVSLAPGPRWDTPAARAAARLVYLLAGVSYYKTAAPPVIDLGEHRADRRELAFLRDFYLQGLGEYAYRTNSTSGPHPSSASSARAHAPPGSRRRTRPPWLPSLATDASRPAPGARRCRAAAAGPVRRRDRLDRDRRGGARGRRRHGAVRGEPAGGPVRGHRAAGRGERAAGGPGRAGDRPAAAALGRARVPQRARAGDRGSSPRSRSSPPSSTTGTWW